LQELTSCWFFPTKDTVDTSTKSWDITTKESPKNIPFVQVLDCDRKQWPNEQIIPHCSPRLQVPKISCRALKFKTNSIEIGDAVSVPSGNLFAVKQIFVFSISKEVAECHMLVQEMEIPEQTVVSPLLEVQFKATEQTLLSPIDVFCVYALKEVDFESKIRYFVKEKYSQ
jgi:hypothetical protein